ncbi:hypothetical protein WJX73_004655 [Symbiochloris irregularis]|uniref:Uncharacterized protein n=1 Tax=Symbiochloris irregularis TaxID=706552 RepID=A0AAW1NLS9_9CHLO
MAIAAASLTLS